MTGSRHSQWRKSSYSAGDCACVEVQSAGGDVRVRDSKAVADPDGESPSVPCVTIDHDAWAELLDALKRGRSIVELTGPCRFRITADGTAELVDVVTKVVLSFTASEVEAFMAGVRAGEFDLGEIAPGRR